MQYLVRTDKPFRGIASALLPSGMVAYTDLTLEEYRAQAGYPLRVVEEAELDHLIDEHHASMITAPEEETEEDFWFALARMRAQREPKGIAT